MRLPTLGLVRPLSSETRRESEVHHQTLARLVVLLGGLKRPGHGVQEYVVDGANIAELDIREAESESWWQRTGRRERDGIARRVGDSAAGTEDGGGGVRKQPVGSGSIGAQVDVAH